jgi:hypothetical protein
VENVIAQFLKKEYPEITHATGYKIRFSVIDKGDQTFTEQSVYVDPDFFEIFTV